MLSELGVPSNPARRRIRNAMAGQIGEQGWPRGSEGRQSTSPAQLGLLFRPTTPALAAATISKVPLKPLPPPLSRERQKALSGACAPLLTIAPPMVVAFIGGFRLAKKRLLRVYQLGGAFF
jgi:hypothetical protein